MTASEKLLKMDLPGGQKKRKLLAQDDDRGGFLNARISITASKTGLHCIIATNIDDKLGPFTLTIERN